MATRCANLVAHLISNQSHTEDDLHNREAEEAEADFAKERKDRVPQLVATETNKIMPDTEAWHCYHAMIVMFSIKGLTNMSNMAGRRRRQRRTLRRRRRKR